MEECKYCHQKFKRVKSHISKCKVKLSMKPCPHCNKLFKRVAAHVYRCPKKPEDKDEAHDLSPEENGSNDGQVENMTPCPHCKKMFKRVAAHVYRCPKKPEENGEISDGVSPDEDDAEQVSDQENGATPGRTSLEEKYSKKKTSNMTPCPHCGKMFKRLASHIGRCSKKPKENGEIDNEEEDEDDEISDENTIENDSSSEEEEEEEEEEVEVEKKAANLKPCPHCQKMFKRVASHINSCPRKPKENGEVKHVKTVEIISSSEDEDEEDEEEEVEDYRETTGNSKHRYYTGITTTKTTETVPKTFIKQSDYRTNYFSSPISNSSPNPRGPDPRGLTRPSTHGDYLPSPMAKSPTNNNAALGQPTPYRYTRTTYETWETESNTSSQFSPLKRPPIHGNQTYHDIHFIDVSGNEEGSLTDFSEDSSFHRSTGSEDSFSYLNQVLKRPPIHKGKSQREANKKQLPTDEEEFFEFHRHVARE